MTAALVCARADGAADRAADRSDRGDAPRAARSARAAASAHRRIRVSSRLAPQIYLGHIAGRAVAVKCAGRLRRDGGPWREWRAARQLRGAAHPHVVRVFDCFEQRAHVFVVMEHCARGDLLALLGAQRPGRRLHEARALRVTLQLARGLRFLHEACNLAHRDVSLENVFVTRGGACKLGDFGLCARADAPARGCVGKPQYAAPEVVARASYDPVAADVWSLGVLLFMLLTGAPLLQLASPVSPDFAAVRAAGCCGVLRAWRLDAQLSAATKDLLARMLELDPARRLQTMAEVLRHPALVGASRGAAGACVDSAVDGPDGAANADAQAGTTNADVDAALTSTPNQKGCKD